MAYPARPVKAITRLGQRLPTVLLWFLLAFTVAGSREELYAACFVIKRGDGQALI
jgi:hypothetical protein